MASSRYRAKYGALKTTGLPFTCRPASTNSFGCSRRLRNRGPVTQLAPMATAQRLSAMALVSAVLLLLFAPGALARQLKQTSGEICTAQYDPVCATLSGTTDSNRCEAYRAGITDYELVPGECPSKAARCVSGCGRVPPINGDPAYDPVCVLTKTKSSVVTSTTYFNTCIAGCYASQTIGSYKGICSDATNQACAGSLQPGQVVCSTMAAAEYPSPCFASQLAGGASFYSGPCGQPEAVRMVNRCPPLNPIYPNLVVDCFFNPPCKIAPPCSTPGSVCVDNYCSGSYFRSTFLVGLCQAVWVDKSGNIDDSCTFRPRGSPAPYVQP